MIQVICKRCGKNFKAQRRTAKYCSNVCAARERRGFPKTRDCRHCGKAFNVVTHSDANRQHCSQACAKAHNTKRVRDWIVERPEKNVIYRANQIAKHPYIWRSKGRTDRLVAIKLLGGKCVVCGATNPHWMHIDYIPTTRNTPYRHPRHLKYIRDHLGEFRILCANHHYELTLTGRIEGTHITQ